MKELTAAQALNTLSARERAEFKSHLMAGCQSCSEDLASYQQVVGLLGFATAFAAPSPRVREQLLRQVRAGSEQPAPFQPERTGSVFVESRSPAAESYRSRPRLSAGSRWSWAVAAALAVIALSASLAWRTASQNAARLRNELAVAQRDASEFRVDYQREKDRFRDFDLALRALSDPGSRVIELEGKRPLHGRAATIYWDEQNRIWAVRTELPEPPAGKVYQLWFITTDQRKVSAGLMMPARPGCSFTAIRLPDDIGPLVAAAITLEPIGGSEQPTLPVFAAGKIS
jgi:hypothetical protein